MEYIRKQLYRLKRRFRFWKDKRKSTIVPLTDIFEHLKDGRLRLIPKEVRIGDNLFVTESGDIILEKGNVFGGIRWHDHIGKAVAIMKRRDCVEIIGITNN